MSNAKVTVQIHSHVDAYSNLELATQKKVSFVLVKVSFHLFISTVIGAYMLAIIIQNAFKSSLREMYYPPFLQNRGGWDIKVSILAIGQKAMFLQQPQQCVSLL